MNTRRILAIVRRDALAFSRDRFYTLMTVLGLVFYVAIFWALPGSVDDTVTIGLRLPDLQPDDLADLAGGGVGGGADALRGVDVALFDDADELRAAVESGDDGVVAGLDLPDGFLDAVAVGAPTTVTLYTTAGTPDELSSVLEAFVGQLAVALVGQEPLVAPTVTVLGPDRAGEQPPLRDQMRPMLAFTALMVETMALGALIAGEVKERTLQAVLVTPASIREVLAAKTLFGTGLAFTEATVLLLAVRTFGTNTLPLLATLLLGAVLVTGIGLLAGSTGRDFLEVVFLSMAFLVPLIVPAIAVLFPGSASWWVRVLPTYPLVQAISAVTIDQRGWADLVPYLAGLAAWCAALFTLGATTLTRRVRA